MVVKVLLLLHIKTLPLHRAGWPKFVSFLSHKNDTKSLQGPQMSLGLCVVEEAGFSRSHSWRWNVWNYVQSLCLPQVGGWTWWRLAALCGRQRKHSLRISHPATHSNIWKISIKYRLKGLETASSSCSLQISGAFCFFLLIYLQVYLMFLHH